MSLKTGCTWFVVPFAFAALLALPGLAPAQDGLGKGGPAPSKEEPPAEEEAPPPKAAAPAKAKAAEEPPPEVKGNRFRLTLKSGARIEGVLPQGLVWEKRNEYGEFVDATETEKGAGLRLNFVLGMEGDIFIHGKDIAEIKDLGALTKEQRLAIQEMILAARKKNIEEREKIIREEMAKQAAEAKEAEKAGAKAGAKDGDGAKGGAKEGADGKKEEAAEADRKKGDELLDKFPPPEWGQKRLSDILRREIVNGIFRNDLEAEFITNFQLWKAALERREKAEEEKKAAEKKEAGGGEEGAK